MDYELEKQYLRILANNEFGPIEKKSLTNLLLAISQIDRDYLTRIQDEDTLFSMRQWLADETAQLGVRLNITNQKERPLVLKLLAQINPRKIGGLQDSPLVEKINAMLDRRGFSFKTSEGQSSELVNAIKKAKLIVNAIDNLNLIKYFGTSQEILAYTGRYQTLSIEIIRSELDFLEAVRDKELTVHEDKELHGHLLVALLKTGHPLITLIDKQLDDLVRILFYKIVAAQAVLNVQARRGNQAITKQGLFDEIAIILVTKIRDAVRQKLSGLKKPEEDNNYFFI